jgi:hypothetical protein
LYYLLCYDEQTLLEVLSRSDLVGDNVGRARDYMEKMVQVRIDVPPLREAQEGILVDAEINAILQRSGLTLGPDGTARLSQAYHDHLKDRLATPRAINRLFAQLDAFYGVIRDEIDFVDYLIISFIRTSEHGVYKLIQRRRAELTGSEPSAELLRAKSKSADLDMWRQLISDANVESEHVDGVIDLLASLFLPIRAAKDQSSFSRAYLDDIGRRRGVGHPDYFDRYYAFGVPTEDIADSVVAEAMQELVDGTSGAALEEFSRRLLTDTDKLVRKLSGLRDEISLPAQPLIQRLADVFDQIPSGSIFTSRPDLNVVMLTCELLVQLDPADGTATLISMAIADGGTELAVRSMRTFRQLSSAAVPGKLLPLTWMEAAEVTTSEIVKERLNRALSEPLADVPTRLFKELIWSWHDVDAPGVSQWLREQVAAGRWDLLEVLAKYITFDKGPAGETLPQPMLGELNLGEIDDLFGLDTVMAQLHEGIDSAEPVDRWTPAVGPDQAKSYVLWALRNVRDRQVQEAK